METKIIPVEGKMGDLLHRTHTTVLRRSFVKVDGCVLAENYRQFADAIENFEVRDDDIWVCSYPKSGTTWTQEMVWNIVNDLNFEGAKVPITERFPFLELSAWIDRSELMRSNPDFVIPDRMLNSLAYVANKPSPRFIKTHLPFNLLPRQLRNGEKRPKIVHIVRNPKDTCISFYHYVKLADGFNGTFEEFYTLFLAGTEFRGPFWSNVLGYWNNRQNLNMLWLRYEEMKADLPSVISKTAAFLDKELTDVRVSSLSEHLSFANMKQNQAVNYEESVSNLQEIMQTQRDGKFMRCGTTDQWKTIMSPELIKRFDEWTDEHLQGTGLSL